MARPPSHSPHPQHPHRRRRSSLAHPPQPEPGDRSSLHRHPLSRRDRPSPKIPFRAPPPPLHCRPCRPPPHPCRLPRRSPANPHLRTHPQGKPALTPTINPIRVTFNLSHSNGLALLAIALKNRIGIDLEHREPGRDLAQIATRSFSPTEAAAFFSLPEDQRTDAFYACWTLKEAYLKATGDGLSTPLDSFEVHFPPTAPASLAGIAGLPYEHSRWKAYSFTMEDHAAALIAEGRRHTIYRAQWSPQTDQTP